MKHSDGWKQALQTVKDMTTDRLRQTWDYLGLLAWNGESRSSYDGVTMDEWAGLVKSELDLRTR
jgi:hypothetical protein